MHQEVTRRANAGTAAYMPLARTVIVNQGIERSNRQALASSLFFSVLLSGAGTWPAAHCSFCRGAQRTPLGNFRGTAAAACDSEVLRELGASSLAIELRKARLMYVPHLVCVERSLLAAVLQSPPEDPWVNALRADLADMKARSGGKLPGVPPISQDPQPWCSRWRSFPRPWKELVAAVYKGVVGSGTPEAPVLEEEVQCPQCERSMGATLSHAVRTHGKRDQLGRFLLSAECPACSKVFPSRARALHHARYPSKSCQLRLLDEDFSVATESELEGLDSELAKFRAKCRREGVSSLAASEQPLGVVDALVSHEQGIGMVVSLVWQR